MDNILKGIQYRTLNPALPSWNVHVYTEWLDVEPGLVTFPSGTEFRVKKEFTYEVWSAVSEEVEKKLDTKTSSKDKAMSRVATLAEEEHCVQLQKFERATPGLSTLLAERGVQFKAVGSDKWCHPNYLSTAGQGSPVVFRLRPDNYFEISISTGIASSKLDFDDIDALEKYLIRQLRTSENNIVITRRSYGFTLS